MKVIEHEKRISAGGSRRRKRKAPGTKRRAAERKVSNLVALLLKYYLKP